MQLVDVSVVQVEEVVQLLCKLVENQPILNSSITGCLDAKSHVIEVFVDLTRISTTSPTAATTIITDRLWEAIHNLWRACLLPIQGNTTETLSLLLKNLLPSLLMTWNSSGATNTATNHATAAVGVTGAGASVLAAQPSKSLLTTRKKTLEFVRYIPATTSYH